MQVFTRRVCIIRTELHMSCAGGRHVASLVPGSPASHGCPAPLATGDLARHCPRLVVLYSLSIYDYYSESMDIFYFAKASLNKYTLYIEMFSS